MIKKIWSGKQRNFTAISKEYNEFKMFINRELKHRIRLENFGRLKFSRILN